MFGHTCVSVMLLEFLLFDAKIQDNVNVKTCTSLCRAAEEAWQV